jgi:hypothetical protein
MEKLTEAELKVISESLSSYDNADKLCEDIEKILEGHVRADRKRNIKCAFDLAKVTEEVKNESAIKRAITAERKRIWNIMQDNCACGIGMWDKGASVKRCDDTPAKMDTAVCSFETCPMITKIVGV